MSRWAAAAADDTHYSCVPNKRASSHRKRVKSLVPSVPRVTGPAREPKGREGKGKKGKGRDGLKDVFIHGANWTRHMNADQRGVGRGSSFDLMQFVRVCVWRQGRGGAAEVLLRAGRQPVRVQHLQAHEAGGQQREAPVGGRGAVRNAALHERFPGAQGPRRLGRQEKYGKYTRTPAPTTSAHECC